MPDLHGAPLTVDTPDTLPDYWQDDPDLWFGVCGDMPSFLAWERATEGDGDDNR